MTEYKREEQLRERAERLNLIARKRNHPFYRAVPGWMIIDANTKAVLAGAENGHTFELTYTQAEAFISEQEKNTDE